VEHASSGTYLDPNLREVVRLSGRFTAMEDFESEGRHL